MNEYAETRKSGIPWIGPIPIHWKTIKLKYLGEYINGYAFKPEDWAETGLPIIRIQDLTKTNNDPNLYSGTLEQKHLINNGDLLVSWAATLDAYLWEGGDGWLNQHIFKVMPHEMIDKGYMYWLLKIAMRQLNEDNKHGIMMEHLTLPVFENFMVPLSPLAEQASIAEYLDAKIAEIDSLIEQTERSIELLEEYRKSVISEAVTKGLDPDAPMKDSGIEWIGEIPEHWETAGMKRICESRNGLDYSAEDICSSTTPDAKLVLRSANIKNGKLSLENSVYVNKTIPDNLELATGDLIVVRTNGSRDLVGKSALVDIKESCTAGAFMLIVRSQYAAYIHWLMESSLLRYYMGLFSTSTVNQMSNKSFGDMVVPVPDEAEMLRICAFLDEFDSKIRAAIAAKRTLIDRLEQYRKSLISEAVTGKFKVPGVE